MKRVQLVAAERSEAALGVSHCLNLAPLGLAVFFNPDPVLRPAGAVLRTGLSNLAPLGLNGCPVRAQK